MGSRLLPDIHIHVHGLDTSLIERKLDDIMAQIDDLRASIEELTASVNQHLANEEDVTGALAAITAERDALLANDAVDNAQLEGLTTAVDDLTDVVQGFNAPPADVPVDPPVDSPPAEGPAEDPGNAPAPL